MSDNDILRMDGEGPFDSLTGNKAFGRLFKKYLALFGNQLLQNNEYLAALNNAGSANLSLLKADATDNTVLNAATGKQGKFAVNNVTIGTFDVNSIDFPTYNLMDGSDKNYQKNVHAAGTVYTLTNVSAAIDFGTTDPAIVLDKAGTYLLLGRVNLLAAAATFAASRNVTLKLRRTNNTPADITNSSTVIATPILTTETQTIAAIYLPPVIVTTANLDDAITIFADVSTVPSAGALNAVEASIQVIRLY